MKNFVSITKAESYSWHLLRRVKYLIRQLDATAPPLEKQKLEEILSQPNQDLLVAKLRGKIVGVTTITFIKTLCYTKGIIFIEDVIVDPDFRGQGIGEEMVKAAIRLSKNNKAEFIDLTSNPARVPAIKLYTKLGFKKRETNVYRLTL